LGGRHSGIIGSIIKGTDAIFHNYLSVEILADNSSQVPFLPVATDLVKIEKMEMARRRALGLLRGVASSSSGGSGLCALNICRVLLARFLSACDVLADSYLHALRKESVAQDWGPASWKESLTTHMSACVHPSLGSRSTAQPV
jgi:hypothetical protein